ncbi:hypothetical protein QC762_0083940 [Podospora pseudocomata]|uniref:Uncharacterized protein n=1 Tax=Podospora pseudocomata TaxID=2093779 RepID=A0ABR0GCH7_9PEZI|nr:hypothetical protein QC762_0083940 [Podospora pseudocomata]
MFRRIRNRLLRRPVIEPEPPLLDDEEPAWAFIRNMIRQRVIIIAMRLGCDMNNVPNLVAAMQIADIFFDIVRLRANQLGYERPLWVPI